MSKTESNRLMVQGLSGNIAYLECQKGKANVIVKCPVNRNKLFISYSSHLFIKAGFHDIRKEEGMVMSQRFTLFHFLPQCTLSLIFKAILTTTTGRITINANP